MLIETLDGLEEQFAADLPAGATVELRARLHDEHERALEALKAEDTARSSVEALADAAARTADWDFARDDFAALEPDLRRIYRRGRERFRAACSEPSAENLHDCRKRVKDLWHAAQLLRPAHPKRMKRVSRRAHDLADLLGDHHDLSVLRDYVEVHPHHFRDAASRDALLAVIDPRRDGAPPRAEARPRCLRACAQALRRGHRAGLAQARREPLSASRADGATAGHFRIPVTPRFD